MYSTSYSKFGTMEKESERRTFNKNENVRSQLLGSTDIKVLPQPPGATIRAPKILLFCSCLSNQGSRRRRRRRERRRT